MSDELPDVPALQRLEPPPGGIAMLRERLDDAARPRRARWLALAVPALAAVVIWLVVRQPHATPPVATLELSPPAAPVADRNVGDNFYWVDSTPVSSSRATISVEQLTISSAPVIP
jgi:hypothetical protein